MDDQEMRQRLRTLESIATETPIKVDRISIPGQSPASGAMMLVLLLAFVFVVGLLLWDTRFDYDPATVGGTEVPSGLHCIEDSVIGFVPKIPGTETPAEGLPLGCVHIDSITKDQGRITVIVTKRPWINIS